MVAVTPRGASWRRVNRLGVALVPLSLWVVVVSVRPGHVSVAQPGWWLLGGATVLLVAGSAALASDDSSRRPARCSRRWWRWPRWRR